MELTTHLLKGKKFTKEIKKTYTPFGVFNPFNRSKDKHHVQPYLIE